jgi:hypothetical protein
MSKNHRPKLAHKLSKEIYEEFISKRTTNSWLGDKFENLKTKMRFRFDNDELEMIALLAATVVLDCDALVRVQEVRSAYISPTTLGEIKGKNS